MEYELLDTGVFDEDRYFDENETNNERLFPGQKNESHCVKDGIHD
jgi:hypothetical protein